jgi:hypothetical protein
MKAITLFGLLVFLHCTALAQDVGAVIKEGNRLENLPDEKAAFTTFKEVLRMQPANVYALNKCSELCSRIGKRRPDKASSNDYYQAAVMYAATALKIDSTNSESNCVMAIALGRSSLNKSGKEKIAAASEIKKYVDLSIKNDPHNFKAWHVLGRWNFELSTLNFIERTAAKLIYGAVPAGTLNDAIYAFEKSNSITDGFILNYFELARAYQKNDENRKAITTLNKMLLLTNQTEDDPMIKEDGRRLLKELQ